MSAPGHRRLFLALWPDAVLRMALAALVAEGRWRPVASGDLHLTVLFLGAVPETQATALHAALARLQLPAFVQTLTQLEFWEHGRLACVSGEPAAGLLTLHRALAALAKELQLQVEDREFRPHVTLARARLPTVASVPALQPLAVPLQLAAREFVLAESRGGAGEPRPGRCYRLIGAWPLAGG